MTMPQPILCAVDFSKDSEVALLWAAGQADRAGARLVVLHVVHDPASSPGFYHQSGADRLRPMEDLAREKLAGFLADVRKRHPQAAGLGTVEPRLVTGLPPGRICEVAAEIDAGQVVVGSRGLTGLPHIMLGSVAERVAQMARAPVTVVKAAE